MDTLEHIQIHFSTDNIIWLNLSLGFLMLGVAIELKPGDFAYIFKNPKAVMTGFLSQWLWLPLLTLALVWVIRPEYNLALGMILVAACPGGNISNYTVHLAGANVALSIVLTIISTLICAVSTPFIFQILQPWLPDGGDAYLGFQIAFRDMFLTIFQLILVPLIVGISLNYFYATFVQKIKKYIKSLSLMIFSGFVIVALAANFQQLTSYLHLVFWIVFIHNFLALVTGYVWSRHIIHLSVYDSRAISIETGIQNSGLALILIFNFFNANGGMALIAAWWSIWHLISSFAVAQWWRRSL